MPAPQLTDHRAEPDLPDLPDLANDWAQIIVGFPDWTDATRLVVQHLNPLLDDGRWWYVRKHPVWRLRHRTADTARLHRHLDSLTTGGVLRSWHPSTYEPETHAFGGPAAMHVAHELFCRDSTTALALTQPDHVGGGRAEISVLAITHMLRDAALEPYEQGDVWARVVDLRHGATPAARPASNPSAANTLAVSVRRLLILDTGPTSPLLADGTLTRLSTWLDAFTTTGHQLADLHRTGGLHRGLRAVLAYHVIFHWNRLAIPATHQDLLARLARDTLIPPDLDPTR